MQSLPQHLVQLIPCRPVLGITQDWSLELVSTVQAQLMLSACSHRIKG